MATDKKISELPRITAPAESDLLPIVDGAATVAITRADLLQVVDNLVSDSATKPLSAKQGAILKALINAATPPIGTYAEMRARAAAAPLVPFTCVITDNHLYALYCGDITQGDGGFLTIQSWVESGGIT